MEYKLSDFMELKKKKLTKDNGLNLIYSPTGSGKTYFVFNKFFNETFKFTDDKRIGLLRFNPNKVLYVVPTTMLRDEILTNIPYTMLFGKGSIAEAKGINSLEEMIQEDNGTIKVITYAKLGYLLGQTKIDYNFLEAIIKNFNCIIFDEFHELYRYSKRYDNENSEYGYFSIIDNLDTITSNVLSIGLTATPQAIVKHHLDQTTIHNKIKSVILESEQNQLVSLKEKDTIKCRSIDNIIRLMIDKRKIKNKKMLIYTKRVSKQREYAEILNNKGINTRILFSDNRDDFGDNEEELKNYILGNKTLPSDIQCLIINMAYECGWNLHDENVDIVLIDSSDETEIIQARSRVRHDISKLYYISKQTHEDCVDDDNIKFAIPTKFMNKTLTKELKQQLMDIYGRVIPYSTAEKVICSLTWTQFKEQLEFSGYEIKNNKIVKIGSKSNNNKSLKKFIGKDLDDKKQEKLINFLDLKNENGRQIKSVSKINEYLKAEYNCEIITKRKAIKGKQQTYWIIKSL